MRLVSCVLLAAVAALAGPAGAVESLTGTYQTKTRCVGLFDGEKSVTSAKDEIWYVDDLADGNVYLHLPASGSKYHGWLEVNTQKPDQGIVGLADCGFTSVLPQGEARVLRVKTSPGKVKAVLKGTGLSIRNFGAAVCTHTFTRISGDVPMLDSSCP
jgi:hypothetical protein